MTSRLFRGEDIERGRQPEGELDPIAEGARYQLSATVSLAIWERVSRERIGGAWRRDEEGDRQRFRDVAARVAARGGSLGPAPGKLTRHDAKAPKVDSVGDAFANLVPGKTTQVLVEARRWEPQTRDVGATAARTRTPEGDEPIARELAEGMLGTRALTSARAVPHREAGALALRSPEIADPNRSPDDSVGEVAAPLNLALRYSRGVPLATEVRRRMERLLGQPFDDVVVHVDNGAATAATAINARAFTIANRIFFRDSAYAPETPAGLELLAHELAHVIQWRQGRVPQVASAYRVSDPSASLEQEAATIGRDVATRARALARSDDGAVASHYAGEVETRRETPGRGIGLFGGMVLRDGPRDPHASLDTIPTGGTPVDKVGIVAWDGSPALRLRSSASTAEDNLISQLAFNTHLQVIKELPGKWYFVLTEHGQLGYVAKDYVKTNLPEPNAKLHRVEAGLPGFAISIAERYYKRWADDWGQDLRFYVNVLAWVNRRPVPDTSSGWRDVHFNAGELIWVPTHELARSLRGVVNSGSRSHNIAEAIGIADFLDRVGELWDDIRAAIALSLKYIPQAIGRHVEAALWDVLESLATMLVLAVAILAISTGVGAVGGGVGAAPGAAAGFEIGMALLNWLGVGMLIAWIGQSLLKVGGAFGTFSAGCGTRAATSARSMARRACSRRRSEHCAG